MKRIAKNIFITIFIAGLFAFLIPGLAFGEGEGTIISTDKNGLVIYVPEKTQDTGNLNPGDKKHSCLKLVNEGNGTITVYIKTNILSEISPRGGELADIMALTIKDGDNNVVSKTFREVKDMGNISLGTMTPGLEKEICLYTNLPEETGNDYQGASFKANWTFTTERKTSGGSGDDSGGGNKDKDPSGGSETPTDPPVDVDDDQVPEGGPERGDVTEGDTPEIEGETEVVEIVEVEIPFGTPEIPKTGRDLPYPYYIIGALVVLTGLGITFRRKL